MNTEEKRKKIIVVGGSAAGPKAAARARRMDEHAKIVIYQKSPELSMASCGYPYYVGGFFDDRNALLATPTGVVRDPAFYLKAKGIDAHVNTEVVSIDRGNRSIRIRNLETGQEDTAEYDRLILATGAVPRRPPIPGIDLKGVSTLQSMQDADYLRKVRDEKKIQRAVIIGGGLIGIESTEAMHLAGFETTIVELSDYLLPFLDPHLSQLMEKFLRSKGVGVVTRNGVQRFLGTDGHLTGIELADGSRMDCELAVVAIGVSPQVRLGVEAGLKTGVTGGLLINEYMQTSDENIYAAGDCVESLQRITGASVHAPFGDLANLEGRVAGENAIEGPKVCFPGTIQTGICKIFDQSAGSTGLTEKQAREAGFDIETVVNAGPDKPGFMGSQLLVTKLVAERKSGRILGAQCVGPGDVSRQLSIWAMAILGKLSVNDMVHADLPYAPPYSLAIDHSIATAHILENKMRGLMKGISARDLKGKLDSDAAPFLLDVRGPDEFAQMKLGIGEKLIPLGMLRGRLDELPKDKNAEIVTYCKISLRGYEAQRILQAHGYSNVNILEGGLMAWPYGLNNS